MSSYTVRVSGYDDDGAPAATTFTVDARDPADAANEALAAARDCGWQDCNTGRITETNIATCGACGLTWNDAIPTSLTPAPSARCPFEYQHHEDGTPTHPDEIPADFPVRPISHDPRAVSPAAIAARLEELRAALRAENISYGELVELQGLSAHIAPGDVELLEPAGVPEFPEEPDPYDLEPEPERRPEPTTHGGETAHQLARRILNQDRKTRPAGDFEEDAEELARLVLASDTLEELEQQ